MTPRCETDDQQLGATVAESRYGLIPIIRMRVSELG